MKTLYPFNQCAALLILAAAAAAGSPKLAPDLAQVGPEQTVDVIVRYKASPEPRHYQSLERRGARLMRSLEILNSTAYRLKAGTLQELANDPDVEYIAPDRPVKAMMDISEPTLNANTALKYGWDGNGITVAIIDSGIVDSHPDLQDSSGVSRVVYAQNFNLSEGNDYFDRFGHGTHVAAILGGNGKMSSGAGYTRTFKGSPPRSSSSTCEYLTASGAAPIAS